MQTLTTENKIIYNTVPTIMNFLFLFRGNERNIRNFFTGKFNTRLQILNFSTYVQRKDKVECWNMCR